MLNKGDSNMYAYSTVKWSIISFNQLSIRIQMLNELVGCAIILVNISITLLKWSLVGALVRIFELSPLDVDLDVINRPELTMKCSCLIYKIFINLRINENVSVVPNNKKYSTNYLSKWNKASKNNLVNTNNVKMILNY